jgi:hypothetical protein
MLNIFVNYPIYDSLNVHKGYSFEYTSGLYNDLVDLLLAMNEYCNNQKILLKNYKVKQNYGLNINNFVFAFENKINDQIGKIDLFTKYMHFFVEIHIKYYNKFLTKIRLMYSQINHDIKFDDNTSRATNDILISDLKSSVDDDTQIIKQISKQISIMETNYSTPRKDPSLNIYIPGRDDREIVVNNMVEPHNSIENDQTSEYSISKTESIYSQEQENQIYTQVPLVKPKRKYTKKPKI